MKEADISIFNKEGEKLAGLMAMPSVKKERYPTVILVHGFDVTKSEFGLFDVLSKSLSDSGFLVYRFDFSGCGDSEGDYSKTSLTKLKDDLSCIIDSVKSQDIVDPENIGILAQSFGTSVFVSLHPDAKAVVLMGSISHPGDVFKKQFQMLGSLYNPDDISIRLRSDGRKTVVRKVFWDDFENYDLPEDIKKIRCPVLFINGSKDTRIPISERDSYFSNANEPKEKVVIEGASHGLNPKRDEVSGIVVEWFKRWMG